jgi:hypothetical protein
VVKRLETPGARYLGRLGSWGKLTSSFLWTYHRQAPGRLLLGPQGISTHSVSHFELALVKNSVH